MKDEFWAWFGGIVGAIVVGLVIVAFITGYAEGSAEKMFALFVTLLCFGLGPILWSADLLGGWTLKKRNDDEDDDMDEEDEDRS